MEAKYEPLSPATSSEQQDDERTTFLGENHPIRVVHRKHSGLILLVASAINVVLFITSCALFGTWYYNTHLKLNAALRGTSTYSPLHDLVDLELHPARVNGTLYPTKDGSIAREKPNDQADEIWEEWELVRMFPVTADQIRAMGKDPSTVAKFEDADWGMGDDAYVSFLDTFHHLHCLNSLRKMAYPDHYPDAHAHEHASSKTPKEMHGIHINHCVDILMQTLMCSGHVGLATMHWVADHPYPFPDMSVNRQCVNFEKLVEWRKENTVNMTKYNEVMYKSRHGVDKELPAPDQFYQYYRPNWTNPNHLNGANPGEDFNL